MVRLTGSWELTGEREMKTVRTEEEIREKIREVLIEMQQQGCTWADLFEESDRLWGALTTEGESDRTKASSNPSGSSRPPRVR
jgi:cytosine/adenosine deaminase-related metal-dependent hydrolase